jgi:ribosomal protein S18 acetylase RimI-like enzyme
MEGVDLMAKVDKNLKVEYIKLKMVRLDLENIPEYSMPHGFKLKFYKIGEEPLWARIEAAAGEFESEEAALSYFNTQFADYKHELENRCLFIVSNEGKVIGTAMAQESSDGDKSLGRVGWVGIDPEFQGLGLSKPLLSQVMKVLKEHHEKVYLTTQTTSFRAVNMYLNFGFLPAIESKGDREAWKYIEKILDRRVL